MLEGSFLCGSQLLFARPGEVPEASMWSLLCSVLLLLSKQQHVGVGVALRVSFMSCPEMLSSSLRCFLSCLGCDRHFPRLLRLGS